MRKILSVGCLIASAVAHSAAAGGDSFRIMTYNIRHGTPTDNNHINLAATAAAIAAESPDFVCLQEVDRNRKRSGHVDQTAYLAEAAGFRYGTFAPALRHMVSGADDGEYGIAILSKTAPLSTNMVPLVVEGAKEKRMLLVCEFEDFYIANSHLDTVKTSHLEAVATISNAFANLSKPVFFTGDWNSTPPSATLEKMNGFMTVISPESGVATCGKRIIDYIAVDSANAHGFSVRSSRVKRLRGVSDHNPVVCDIEKLPAAAKPGP